MTEPTTRELLEGAARAAGIEVSYHHGCGDALELVKPRGFQVYWNPLTDDGDALRLARACKMAIDFKEGTILYYVGGECIGTDFTPGNDEEEALAILKAAAEIGRNMK